MAKPVHTSNDGDTWYRKGDIAIMIMAAVSAEREAIAKMAEARAARYNDGSDRGHLFTLFADAIRRRE